MSLQLRRDTATNHTAATGDVAELGYETDTKRLAVHDGATAGGLTIPHDGHTLASIGTPAAGDLVLIRDVTDSNKIKTAAFSEFGGGGIADVVEDTTPQLGGNLDLNGNTVGAASAADLTKLSEVTATSTELNYVDGVTSSIQTQLNGKASTTAASATAAGISELATTAEINTGTDTGRTITPDGLSASYAGTKEIAWEVFASDEAVATGDGTSGIPIPASMNGMNIVSVRAIVHTQGVTGTTNVQIRRRRGGTNADVLSTLVTLGAEYHVADGVINATNDDLATGDLLFCDVDAVHSGTAPNGLSVVIEARLP